MRVPDGGLALVYADKAPQDRMEVRWAGQHPSVISTADEQALLENRIVATILHKAQ